MGYLVYFDFRSTILIFHIDQPTRKRVTIDSRPTMKTYYRTTPYSDDIATVEVERETEHCVWCREGAFSTSLRRRNKRSDYENYWATREEAVEHMRRLRSDKLELAKTQLESAERKLAAFNAKYPTP